jgi:hypothetical protein
MGPRSFDRGVGTVPQTWPSLFHNYIAGCSLSDVTHPPHAAKPARDLFNRNFIQFDMRSQPRAEDTRIRAAR